MSKQPISITKAVIYSRVSTVEQSKGHSLAAQQRACREHAERMGWEIVAEFSETVSTRRTKRPQAALALRAARLPGCVLVSAAMDRVARTMTENVSLIAEAAAGKLAWVTLNHELDTTTADGRFMAHVKAAQSQYERDRISERVKAGLAQARLEGVRTGQPRLVAPALEERILEMKRTTSYLKIARILNREGIKAPKGGLWSRSSLQRICERARIAA